MRISTPLRGIVFLVLAWMMVSSVLAHAFGEEAFSEGVKHYEEGRFEDAIRVFEEIVQEGDVSITLYYNLGNAYYRRGFKGKAIWAYRKALRLDPRDEDSRWNLEFLKRTLVDREEGGRSLTRRIEDIWSRRVSHDETALLFVLVAVLFALSCAGFAWVRTARRFFGNLSRLLLIGLVVLGTLAGVLVYEIRFPRGVIHETEVYARYGPSGRDTRAFLLHEGTTVYILKSGGGWFFVEFGKTKKGWIPRSSILLL